MTQENSANEAKKMPQENEKQRVKKYGNQDQQQKEKQQESKPMEERSTEEKGTKEKRTEEKQNGKTALSPIKRFSYPIFADKKLPSTVYYQALASAKGGFYPLGSNQIWHGGIHFDAAALANLGDAEKRIPISSLADGEVVAYRMNQHYPRMIDDEQMQFFSTGFVLVRHRLMLPALPKVAKTETNSNKAEVADNMTATEKEQNKRIKETPQCADNPAPDEPPSFLFYSLYMHQLAYCDYAQKDSKIEKPAYWQTDKERIYRVKTDTVRLRSEASSKVVKLTFKKDALITLTGKMDSKKRWAQLAEVKTPMSQAVASYGQITEEEKTAPTGWVYFKELVKEKPELKPHQLDKTVILDTPFAVKAGDLLGYVGHYQFSDSAQKANSVVIRPEKFNPLLHVECFTAENLPAFIQQTRPYAEQLEERHKTLLHVDQNVSLVAESAADAVISAYQDVMPLETRGSWTKVRECYYVSGLDRLTDLGDYNANSKGYSLNAIQKEGILARVNQTLAGALTLANIPDSVILMKQYKDSQIRDVAFYKNGEIKEYWINTTEIDATEKRRTIATLWQAISAWTKFPIDFSSHQTARQLENPASTQPELKTAIAQTFEIKSLSQIQVPKSEPLASAGNQTLPTQGTPCDSTPSKGETETWYKIETLNRQSQPISGWVKEKQEGVCKITPWHWPDFEALQEQHQSAQLYERMVRNDAMTLTNADYTPSMKALHRIIQQLDLPDNQSENPAKNSVDTNQALTQEQIKKALAMAPLSHLLSRLLVHYESEWYDDGSLKKWHDLDAHLGYDELLKSYQQKSIEFLSIETLMKTQRVAESVAKQIKESMKAYFEQLKQAEKVPHDFTQKIVEQHAQEIKKIERAKARWEAEKNQRIKSLIWWTPELAEKLTLPQNGKVWHMHPIALVESFGVAQHKCDCELLYADKFKVAKYVRQYGPVYWGSKPMEQYTRWDNLISKGNITVSEKLILIAMSANEGNMDAIQSYDSEVITAGAMQKTVKDTLGAEGMGELSIQLSKFRDLHPELYEQHVVNCGWMIEGNGTEAIIYYSDVNLTKGQKLTSTALKKLIRQGCNEDSYRKIIYNKPLAALVKVISLPEYLDLQIIDFIERLHSVENKIVSNTNMKIKNFVKSNFGRAVILDHSVNRPGYVVPDFKKALANFHLRNPSISLDPQQWGKNHDEYESLLLEEYKLTRRMTSSVARFNSLKGKL